MDLATIKGSFLVVLSAFIFGLSPVLIKFSYRTAITPMMLLVCSYVLSTVIFIGYFLLFKYPFKIQGLVLIKVLLVGVLLRGGTNICFFVGYKYIQASLGELIFYLYPAFTLIIATSTWRKILHCKKFWLLLFLFVVVFSFFRSPFLMLIH